MKPEQPETDNPYATDLQPIDQREETDEHTRFDAIAFLMILGMILFISIGHQRFLEQLLQSMNDREQFASTIFAIIFLGFIGSLIGICLGSQSIDRVRACTLGAMVGFVMALLVSALIATADPFFMIAAILVTISTPILLRFRRA